MGPEFLPVPPAELKQAKCEMTLFDGKVVYESRPGPPSGVEP